MSPLLERFRAQAIPPEEWTHEAHVRVALEHLQLDPGTALDRMRAGIQALNAVNGVLQTPEGGYHETLTRVWLDLVRLAWERYGEWEGAWALLQDKKLPLRFYSRERLLSWDARVGWLEPDLAPLAL